MKYLSDVPDSWWRFVCERGHTAIACVAEDNRFVWANEAWVRLVGYSQHELEKMTWLDITFPGDVGGDLASAKELVDGGRTSYTMSKRYVHKLGHIVRVETSVSRFPEVGNFVAFAVEAMPEVASHDELNRLHKANEEKHRQIEAMVKAVASRIQTIEEKTVANADSRNTSTINIGRNNTATWVVVIIMVALFGWLVYQSFENDNPPAPIDPPSVESRQ